MLGHQGSNRTLIWVATNWGCKSIRGEQQCRPVVSLFFVCFGFFLKGSLVLMTQFCITFGYITIRKTKNMWHFILRFFLTFGKRDQKFKSKPEHDLSHWIMNLPNQSDLVWVHRNTSGQSFRSEGSAPAQWRSHKGDSLQQDRQQVQTTLWRCLDFFSSGVKILFKLPYSCINK